MIGVVCHERERRLVDEFFELFKTPWEHWQPGGDYAVVLVSAQAPVPRLDGALAVVYGPHEREVDRAVGLKPHPRPAPASIDAGVAELPIYGECAGFSSVGRHDEISDGGEIVDLPLEEGRSSLARFGYDLFAEVERLLTAGQPVENAYVPALDVHIDLLRRSMLAAGVPFVEIPPTPAGFDFVVCLTHDVDFLDITRHGLDRTALGFLYRATIGSIADLATGRSSWGRAATNLKAAAALPLVHLGVADDPWSPFEQYLRAEGDLRSTFFLIPFRDRAGERATKRRAVRYDVDDARDAMRRLAAAGFEFGVHGIDGWHDTARGREELARISDITADEEVGVRTHWLLSCDRSLHYLDHAGYAYDSTMGYNDAVGFRAGTAQVFRPPSASRLLELPLHIQDTALFFRRRLHLSEHDAWLRCREIFDWVERYGGVLTLLWHERSLAPERQWGEFYARLLDSFRTRRTWFCTARDAVRWFRRRRSLRLATLRSDGRTLRIAVEDRVGPGQPYPMVRVHLPNDERPYVDVPVNGGRTLHVDIATAHVS